MIGSEAEGRAWVAEHADDPARMLDQLDRFIDALTEENSRQNLVSAKSLGSMWQRHIADSAQLALHVPRETNLADLGSGAGLPGVVLGILRPQSNVTLIEVRPRRVEWLNRVVDQLGLGNVDVIATKVENAPQRHYDILTARAFAPLARLVPIAHRFSTADTKWLLPKGRSAAQELDELVGWRHTFHVEHSITDADAGILVGTVLGKKGRTS